MVIWERPCESVLMTDGWSSRGPAAHFSPPPALAPGASDDLEGKLGKETKGRSAGFLWASFRIRVFRRNSFGVSLDFRIFLWASFGFPLESKSFIWISFGFPLEFRIFLWTPFVFAEGTRQDGVLQ